MSIDFDPEILKPTIGLLFETVPLLIVRDHLAEEQDFSVTSASVTFEDAQHV